MENSKQKIIDAAKVEALYSIFNEDMDEHQLRSGEGVERDDPQSFDTILSIVRRSQEKGSVSSLAVFLRPAFKSCRWDMAKLAGTMEKYRDDGIERHHEDIAVQKTTPEHKIRRHLNEFLTSYKAAALQMISDDQPNSCSICDIPRDVGFIMRRDGMAFIRENFIRLNDVCDRVGYSWGQAGTDFMLTRNGHGAGFWDRGLGEEGQMLSESARKFGASDLFWEDDAITIFPNQAYRAALAEPSTL